jgi:serine/threonine protein kinase
MLRQQLEESLDDGITPLGLGGARGVLFKVTILTYGYTFVSKGTVRAFIPDLQHETNVYKRLRPAQGRHVPVFLGAVDLREMERIYYYDHRVYVVYMAFLSWGGCSLSDARATGVSRDELRDMAVRSLQTVHREGIRHKDVRDANMFFHEETGVMVIDFERAEMDDVRREALAPVVPNKRRWTGEGRQRKQEKKVTIDRQGFSGEVGELEAIFVRNYS